MYGGDFKSEVGKLIDECGIEAIIMGNRQTDPWSKDLEPFTQSSPSWPKFMRVFPIIKWTYKDVWVYLRGPP